MTGEQHPIPESRRALGRAFHSLPREHGFEPCEVEGTIPDELCGTLYRNGPALFELFDHPYHSYLDGDGAVSAFRFDRGAARAAVRVTVTEQLAEERTAGKAIYSSGFTRGPTWWRRVGGQQKNPTNVHVLAWHGRVFATTDAGVPIELDPWTLETVGPWKLGGAARMTVNAHSRRCPRTGSLFAFGVSMGMGVDLDFYELPRAGEPRRLTSVRAKGFPLVHDLAITEKYVITIVPPVRIGVLPFLAGTAGPASDVHWEPERGCEVILVERAAPHTVHRIDAPAFFSFHLGGAFDRADGTVVGHLCAFERFDLGDAFEMSKARSGQAFVDAARSFFERIVLDPEKGTMRREQLIPDVCEFPSVAPATETHEARFCYPMITRDHRDVVGKLDLARATLEIADLGRDRSPGESTFVARRSGEGEDDGWLLTQVYDAKRHRTGVAVIDAKHVAGGAVATAWLDHHVPPAIHGTWVAGIPG